MKKLLTLFLLLACLAAPIRTYAQGNITVQANTTRLDFPNSLTFSIQARSSANIDQVYLSYRTGARSCTPGNVRVQLDFDPASQVDLHWDWDFKNSGSLPPGAQVTWFWEIRDAAGSTLTTEAQTLTIEDSHYEWQSLEAGNVSVYWTDGGQSFGRMLLRTMQDSLANLEAQAGLQPEGKIRLDVYPSSDALQAAALFLPEWTGGLAISEHGVIMAGIPAGEESWAKDVIPHELAHLVTSERVFNCLGTGIPTWLSEGLAVSAEGPISDYDRSSVENGLKTGALPPLHTLTAGFPANADKANQAYAMSGAVVRYMLSEYGPDKMAALLSTVQSGKRTDAALQEVYGLSTDGLDQAWRASLGYASEVALESPTPTLSVERTAVPTIALWSPSLGQPSPTPALSPTLTPAVIAAAPSPTASPAPAEPTQAPLATSTPIEPTPSAGSRLPCGGSIGAVGILAISGFSLRSRRKHKIQVTSQ